MLCINVKDSFRRYPTRLLKVEDAPRLHLTPQSRFPGVTLYTCRWGGTALFEDGRWHFIAGGKYIDDGSWDGTGIQAVAPDPWTSWGRSPAYDVHPNCRNPQQKVDD